MVTSSPIQVPRCRPRLSGELQESTPYYLIPSDGSTNTSIIPPSNLSSSNAHMLPRRISRVCFPASEGRRHERSCVNVTELNRRAGSPHAPRGRLVWDYESASATMRLVFTRDVIPFPRRRCKRHNVPVQVEWQSRKSAVYESDGSAPPP
jgi:hypothetical protein